MSDLFGNATRGKRLKSEDRIPGDLPFVTAGEADEGISAFIGNNVEVFSKNTITIDMFGSAKYRNYDYGGDDHIAVVHTEKIPSKAAAFLTAAIHKSSHNGQFDYGRNFYAKDADDLLVMLPQKGNTPDFDFMESFIAELEAERVSALSSYLTSCGLTNCELTADETEAIHKLPLVQWKAYRMADLFEKIKTKKLPYQAKELPDTPTDQYSLPCLTSSFQNQGLNYYAPAEGATILRNVISIPSNSDVYRAYFQSNDFTVLSDAYAIRWKDTNKALSPKQYLFMVCCINKVTDRPIYSHKNKLGGWNVVGNKSIQLPQIDGEIDLTYMELLISAIQKLAIKDVVLYVDGKGKQSKGKALK